MDTVNRRATERPNGDVVIIDENTGEVVEIQPSYEERFALYKGSSASFSYHPYLGDILCEKIANGMPLTKISKLPGFPSLSVMMNWQAKYPDFRNKFKEARKILAQRASECLLNVAGIDLETMEFSPIDKDEAKGRKLQFDALRWFAEKSDPSAYTTKSVMHKGDPDQPIQFMINTGIDRSGDAIQEPALEDLSDPNTIEVPSDTVEVEGDIPNI